MHCSEGLFIRLSDSSHHPHQHGASELMGSQHHLQAVGGANVHHQYSTARVKESKTGQPTQETTTQGKCCTSVSQVPAAWMGCASLQYRAEAARLPHPRSPEVKPGLHLHPQAAQADSLLPLSTTHPCTSSLQERQHQRQQYQGLIGMRASHKPSDRMHGFSFGCVPQPRDMLAVPDPTPQAGFDFSQMPMAAWDRSGLGHQGPEEIQARGIGSWWSSCQHTCTSPNRQRDMLIKHVPWQETQAQAGPKPRQVQTTALQGHLQPAAPETHLTFHRLGSLPKLHFQEVKR